MASGRTPGLVGDFTELEVYRESRALAVRISELTESFPRHERYTLVDQLRRASGSIGAQIAEAWAKRRYPRHFVSKLTDAAAERLETCHWLGLAVDLGYVDPGDLRELQKQLTSIGRMLFAMKRKAEDFRQYR